MYPMKDIIDKAVNSKDHSTLVAALTNRSRKAGARLRSRLRPAER